MCGDFEHYGFEDGVPVQAWFEQRGVELPWRLRDGTVNKVTWGACALRFPLGESDSEPGYLMRWPDTGWARLMLFARASGPSWIRSR